MSNSRSVSRLKAENIRLNKRIHTLEDKVLNLVGAIKIFMGGMPGKEHLINNHIVEIITEASKIKIIAPYITEEYSLILEDRAKKGIEIMAIVNDRRFWPEKYRNIYDKLKVMKNLQIINNPNVKFLLIWCPETVLFTSGPLSKESLMKTVLIGTKITEKGKIDDVLKIFNSMLPSFMRD
jgi:predicted transcriptional regulator